MANGEANSSNASLLPTPWWWRFLIAMAVCGVGGATFAAQYFRNSWDGSEGFARIQAGIGAICLFGIAACFSRNLRAVRWKTIFWGVGLQVFLAIFILKLNINGFRPGYELFQAIATGVTKFVDFSDAGARFVFGPLSNPGTLEPYFGNASLILAFTVLPVIIFISSFFSILYFFGILQFIVRLMARVMMYLMGTSGAETLSTAANVFMGQTEAPLIIKPYISKMTQSELLALMVGGMATVAGSVMVAYISLGADRVGILATSVMAAPCSLYLAKLLLPETEQPETGGGVNDPPPETSKYLTRPVAPPQIPNSLEQRHANFIDAAAGGASDGLRLALNVAAMLIAFLALLAMANYMLSLLATNESLWTTLAADIQDGWILVDLFALVVNFAIVVWLMKHVMEYFRPGSLEKMSRPQKISGVILLGLVFLLLADLFLRISPEKLQLEDIFGVLFSPLAFLIGTNPKDIPALAELLGIKLAANEFVAFLRLQELKATMDHRSHVLATYALTGFANFGSVGIQIGGIGALAPERRPDLARLGIPAMLIGFLVTSINAAVAGVFLD